MRIAPVDSGRTAAPENADTMPACAQLGSDDDSYNRDDGTEKDESSAPAHARKRLRELNQRRWAKPP
jgi:hypothetical protein